MVRPSFVFLASLWRCPAPVLLGLAAPLTALGQTRTGTAAASHEVQPEEIHIVGRNAGPESLEDGANAARVLDLGDTRITAVNLGDVFRNAPGVTFRQSGGLGSNNQFTLNGLSGNQVPFFIDGLPIQVIGLPSDPSLVPINLLRGVELYKGVVPIEFGADALGGAVNILTYVPEETAAFLGYEVASFDTHRVAGQVAHRFTGIPLVLSARSFFDASSNDYAIDVTLTDPLGRTMPGRVDRFHDGLSNYGAAARAAVVDVGWADRFEVRGFFRGQDDDIQHGVFLGARPLGAASRGQQAFGTVMRFAKRRIADWLDLDAFIAFSRTESFLTDVSTDRFDWLGNVTVSDVSPGEFTNGVEQTLTDDRFSGRINAEVQLAPDHILAMNLTPTLLRRSIDRTQVRQGRIDRDPAQTMELTGGLAYRSRWLGRIFENDLFGKFFIYDAQAREVLMGLDITSVEETYVRGGVGNALVFQPHRLLRLRASYELTTRLPEPREIFGDGVFISANPTLRPESSHNLNLSAALLDWRTPIGTIEASVWGFLREVDDLIFQRVTEFESRFVNVGSARIFGIEASLAYRLWEERIEVSGNLTVEESEVTAEEGEFAAQQGERLANRPYLYGTLQTRLRLPDVFADDDLLSFFGALRYTHAFFFLSEAFGDPGQKNTIPDQYGVDAGTAYAIDVAKDWRLTGSFEVHNVADSELFDFLRVPRPGRSFHAKFTLGFR